MLPPVAEVYVCWHPEDQAGRRLAEAVVDHFHGTPFTGLIGGAIEVYPRSAGWRHAGDAPRPIPLPGASPVDGARAARLVAVVPVLGTELAAAVEQGGGPWHEYAVAIARAGSARSGQVGVFPVTVDQAAVEGTRLAQLLGRFQGIGPEPCDVTPLAVATCCRDLSQGLAQLAGGGHPDRITVFLSHTKHEPDGGSLGLSELVSLVRSTIAATRLNDFFDARDLQPGRDRHVGLEASAAGSAMLAIRTDSYSSRTWCQREMLVAKRAGMPVVTLDALSRGDERGSFLMDHMPRVPVRRTEQGWHGGDVVRTLDRLVDECLKRALWRHQRDLAIALPGLDVAWWAPHAPEPVTLVAWLAEQSITGRIRVLHPDPPLGPDELQVLEQLAATVDPQASLEIMTPRSFAARGGW